MRKMVCDGLSTHILLDKGIFYDIVIKDKKTYYDFVMSLLVQINNHENGKIVLSNDDEILNLSTNSIIIPDLFTWEINSKKNISLLHKYIIKEYLASNTELNFNALNTSAVKFLEQIRLSSQIDFDYSDEIGLLDILKTFDVKFEIPNVSLFENLTSFLKNMTYLSNIDIFWIIGIHDYFSQKELAELINYMALEKINIISVEAHEYDNVLPNEIRLILDEDLCDYEIIGVDKTSK